MSEHKRKPKSRGNKTGSVYYLESRRCWVAQIVVGWKPPIKEGGHLVPIKKRFSGYKTKKDALAALNRILNGEEQEDNKTSLDEVFQAWKKAYEIRVVSKTLKGYEQAYAYFGELKYRRINTITAAELQSCMDDCPKGKRTHQLMKVVAGLIWAYAFDTNKVKKDITENLYIGKHETKPREPLSPEDIQKIKDNIGKIRYCDYIYCLCYLGFRPGEFLEIKKEQVNCETINDELVYYITEGKKTAAGINRRVIIPKQILPIIIERLNVEGTDYLFPFYYFKRGTTELKELRRMTVNYFDESVFKPIASRLRITGNKVPYSARHSYADKLKMASGNSRDKAALMGHTDYAFTQAQYQSSPLEDLKIVTDSIK
jgi:integrase